MAIRLTTPSSHRKLAKKCQRLSYGSLVCSAADDTVPVVCVWRHILMERACTQTWTLIHQPFIHKHRWSTAVLHRLGVWKCDWCWKIRVRIFCSGGLHLLVKMYVIRSVPRSISALHCVLPAVVDNNAWY